jgi:hypothetical protein
LTLAAAAQPQEANAPVEAAPADTQVTATPREKPTGDAELGAPSERFRKRSGRELLAAVRETLARLARPKDEQLEAAVEELLFVYQELQEDDAMARSHREYYKGKAEVRLQQLSDQLKKRISRNKRLSRRAVPDRIRVDEAGDENLGQRAAGGPAAPRARGGAPPAPPLVGRGRAGPRGRLPNDDYGQQLVDLIQRTIAPSSWDVNGGLGTIYYWRPGRALVVRQTGAVHDEMGDVLGQLRNAGP